MGSKVIVFLGLFLAIMLLLISSQVAARDLAETSNALDTSSEKADGAALDEDKNGYGGGYPGGGGYGGGRGGYGGGGRGGGRRGYGGGGGGGGGRGGSCRCGCCGKGYHKGGCRCCTYAGEKPDADFQAEPQN